LAAFVAGFEILRRARAERSAATDRLVRSLAESLATHEGVARRMQMIGATERVAVYDDYAHHPTAARLATAAIKERHAGAFLAVAFQPHTRSRTEAMFDAFADALGGEGGVDALVVTPVFDARPERQGQIRGSEDEASGAEASDLAARLAARAGGAFAATEAEAVDAVVDAVRDATTSTKTRPAREDDFHGKKQVVVLCLGAGAGFDVARRVFARLDERDPGSASGSAAESRSAASRQDADETTR
jgi:UDP-N-acetylmuramate-alanine ligase